MTRKDFKNFSRIIWTAVFTGLFACLTPQAMAYDTEREDVREFIDNMHTLHGFDIAWLENAFSEAQHKEKIIETMKKPAEFTLTWPEYRGIFLTEERIHAGVTFWTEHQSELSLISEQSGVPEATIIGIIGVETYFGRITGDYRVMDSLCTLAFDYPKRADFFRSELEHYLLLSREEETDPLNATGSYAGAMGMPQFMPSSYRAYAVDADDDGKRDIWNNWSDVIGSIANYLTEHGWQAGQPVAVPVREVSPGIEYDGRQLKLNESVSKLRDKGLKFDADMPGNSQAMLIRLPVPNQDELWIGFNNFYVVTRYNRSMMYAMAVNQLGNDIENRLADEVN